MLQKINTLIAEKYAETWNGNQPQIVGSETFTAIKWDDDQFPLVTVRKLTKEGTWIELSFPVKRIKVKHTISDTANGTKETKNGIIQTTHKYKEWSNLSIEDLSL